MEKKEKSLSDSKISLLQYGFGTEFYLEFLKVKEAVKKLISDFHEDKLEYQWNGVIVDKIRKRFGTELCE